MSLCGFCLCRDKNNLRLWTPGACFLLATISVGAGPSAALQFSPVDRRQVHPDPLFHEIILSSVPVTWCREAQSEPKSNVSLPDRSFTSQLPSTYMWGCDLCNQDMSHHRGVSAISPWMCLSSQESAPLLLQEASQTQEMDKQLQTLFLVILIIHYTCRLRS